MDAFVGLVAAGLATGSVYALIGLGFVFTFRSIGTFNFFHGELAMVAAVVAYLAVVGTGVPLLIGILLGVAGAALIAMIGERMIFTRMLRAEPLAVMLATVAYGIFALRGIAEGVFGDVPRRLPALSEATLDIGGVVVRVQNLLVLLALVTVIVPLWAVFRYTQIGRGLRAVADNPKAAVLVGLNPGMMRLLALAIAGVLGGLAGVLVAPITLVEAHMGTPLLIKAFAVALVGGLTNFRGAVVVGLLLGVFEMLLAFYWDAMMRDLVAFALMMFVLIVAPQGLLAGRSTARV